jgi:hypothetical protein
MSAPVAAYNSVREKKNAVANSPAVIIAVWALLYISRPLELGLYHDDWTIFHVPQTWGNATETFWLFANRPVVGIYLVLANWIAQGNIAILHLLAALLVLVTALILRNFLMAVLSYAFHRKVYLGCNIAVCLWLMMPWTLGTTAWIISNPSLISIIGFCMAGTTLIKSWKFNTRIFPGLLLSVFLSALSYEIFILQMPLLFGLYYLGPRECRNSWPPNITLASLQTGLGLVAAFLARISLESISSLAVKKSLNADWRTLFLYYRNLTGSWIAQAFPDHNISLSVIALAVIVLLTIAFRNILRPNGIRMESLSIASLIAFAGYSLSSLVPALAGYALTGSGINSRVTIGTSLWVTFFLAFVLTATFVGSRRSSLFSLLTSVLLSCILIGAMANQLSDWKTVWKSQKHLLERIDRSLLKSLGDDDILILDQPIARNGVYGFNATWDLSCAIKQSTCFNSGRTYLVAGDYWRVYVSEGKIVQRHGETILGEYSAPKAWVISAKDGMLRPTANNEIIGGPDYP